MNRRTFLAALSAVCAAPLSAFGERSKPIYGKVRKTKTARGVLLTQDGEFIGFSDMRVNGNPIPLRYQDGTWHVLTSSEIERIYEP